MEPTSQERKRFEEERARRILLHIFPEKYAVTALSESPDIISIAKSIGVEVTSSQLSHLQKGVSSASSLPEKAENALARKNSNAIKDKKIASFPLKNGPFLAASILGGATHDLNTAYQRKLDKLNSRHFKKFHENNLFIYSWFIEAEALDDGLRKMAYTSKNLASSLIDFNMIYIFVERILHTICLKDFSIQTYCLDENTLDEIYDASFETIFGMTRREYDCIH